MHYILIGQLYSTGGEIERDRDRDERERKRELDTEENATELETQKYLKQVFYYMILLEYIYSI